MHAIEAQLTNGHTCGIGENHVSESKLLGIISIVWKIEKKKSHDMTKPTK